MWLKYFKESMMVRAKAHSTEEDMGGVEVSPRDLVKGRSSKAELKKTWDFGPSLMTEEMIGELVLQGCFPAGVGMPLGGETVPRLEPHEAVVFKDFFVSGLRLPSVVFLQLVLESFKVQLHQLTPNSILTLSKFCWACESYGFEPDRDTFCAYYELQRQLKKVTIGLK